MLWDETNIALKRLNGEEASRASLIHLAISAILDKKSGKIFKETIERMLKDG